MRSQIHTNELAKRLLLWVSGTAVIVLLFSTHSKFFLLLCLLLSALLLRRCLRAERICFPAPGIGSGTVVGIALTVLLRRFLYSWGDDWKLKLLAERVQRSAYALAFPIGVLGCVLAIPFLLYAVEKLRKYLRGSYGTQLDKFRASCENWSLGKSVLVLSVIFSVALYPLFRANANYNDDIWRIHSGATGWADAFGRHLSEFLSHYLFCGSYTTDLSPLLQLLALILVALAGVIVVRAFRGGATSLWDLIAVVPLCLNPFFLDCISFKMDAAFMGLSILVSVLPLLFLQKSRKAYCIAVFFGMLAVCMTYQTASGIFPMAVLLIAFQRWCKKEEPGKETLKFLLYSAGSYFAAYAVFAKFIMRRIESYVDNGIATPAGILENYRNYIHLVLTDFNREWLLVIGALAIWYLVTAVLVSRQRKWLTACVGVGTLLLTALLSFGLYPALKVPLMARITGVGALIAFLGVGNFGQGEQKLPARVLTVMMAWMLIVFTATYGNALAEQQEYENFRREEILHDLTELPEFYQSSGDQIRLQLTGNVGYAPSLQGDLEKYPALRSILPIQFDGRGHWWIAKFTSSYGIAHAARYSLTTLTEEEYADWPILHESFFHTIHYQDGSFVVVIK